jgi:inosose dehydratase
MSAIAVANAPCSYGAFEITVGIDPHVPDPVSLLDEVAGAGYAGIDLGPPGYLGAADELPDRLTGRDLSLAGGYFPVAFSEPDGEAVALAQIEELLSTFDAAADGGPPPRPTIADAGSAQRASYPGRAASDRTIGWDDVGWARFANTLARLADRCRERGYEPTFHPHTATYVEAPWEIEELLRRTDVGVCLDTGHLLLGGGDPVDAVRSWDGRINHVHLKDARLDVLAGIARDAAPVQEIWRRRAFCRLGDGDVALDRVLDALRDGGYSGWLIVEQDILPGSAGVAQEAAADQVFNRKFLRARGL